MRLSFAESMCTQVQIDETVYMAANKMLLFTLAHDQWAESQNLSANSEILIRTHSSAQVFVKWFCGQVFGTKETKQGNH